MQTSPNISVPTWDASLVPTSSFSTGFCMCVFASLIYSRTQSPSVSWFVPILSSQRLFSHQNSEQSFNVGLTFCGLKPSPTAMVYCKGARVCSPSGPM